MKEGRFTFHTLEEARNLSILLAELCPDPHKIVTGLKELLLNAVEHGWTPTKNLTMGKKGKHIEDMG